ncbi:MAG: hypothetical protein CMP11_06110 [Zetaproteobacteria bacterium]|nr:hypothetical protein [Pseudobdellovibrionaceae bacterium]
MPSIINNFLQSIESPFFIFSFIISKAFFLSTSKKTIGKVSLEDYYSFVITYFFCFERTGNIFSSHEDTLRRKFFIKCSFLNFLCLILFYDAPWSIFS